MRVNKIKKAILAIMLSLCVCTGIVYAANVPKKVLNTRDSVIRVLIVDKYGDEYIGTGFTVSSNSRYVVTNCHVVEDAVEIYVFYDTGEYIIAEIEVYAPKKDICILELETSLRAPGIPIRTFSFGTGESVYALGYPGTADYISGEFLADKQSITITDGIISRIHQGYHSNDTSVKTWIIQSNAAINGGNSGGPLVDEEGRLLGINTFSMNGAEGMSGSIHATELVAILEANNISYKKAGAIPTGVIVGGVLVVILAIVALLYYRKNKTKVDAQMKARKATRKTKTNTAAPQQQTQQANTTAETSGTKVPLKSFYTFNTRLNDYDGVSMVEDFMEDYFQPDEVAGNVPLLFVDNIYIEKNKTLQFYKTRLTEQEQQNFKTIQDGFSAPEVYGGQFNQQTIMYFMGAILYTLTEGKEPLDTIARSTGSEMTFSYSNRARSFIEQAMALEPKDRFRDLKTFLYSLSTMKLKLFAPDEEVARQQEEKPAPSAEAVAPQNTPPAQPAQEPAAERTEPLMPVTEVIEDLPVIIEPPILPVEIEEDEAEKTAMETSETHAQEEVIVVEEAPAVNNMNEQISQTFFTEPKP